MTLPKNQDNILKRRTFAIISHPDAGKTTLTEKLLLYGGAIQLAGEVKARGQRRRAHSDWMKVEQERGISVTASVMTFNFADCVFNLLDTPGHEDFSEDTYRVLTAVDSAVMVLDAAKGIEAQTRKLFEVCRLRDVPIITFINKMDRETRDPFELLDEIEEMLQLDVTPLSWPVGSGQRFRGCWDLVDQRFLIMPRGRKDRIVETAVLKGLEDPKFDELVGESLAESSREEIEMAHELTPDFDFDSYRGGNHTPVFFGSALHNFGVKELLEGIARMAPPPRPQPAVERTVEPTEKKVSGFVFKIQANMDPNHRDRIAFMRLVSGHFNRGMKMKHIRSGKSMNVRNPLLFLAQDRELAEEAWAGDIIGIPNYGNLRIGDTLTEGETLHFTGIPSFAPEYLRRVRPEDPLRAKHLGKALFQLAEEGAAQTFKAHLGSEWIVGVAGALQFDVIADRIRTEYDLAVRFEGTTYQTARWVSCSDRHAMKEFFESNRASMAEDHDGDPVFLARNPWQLKMVAEDWPQVKLMSIKDTENRIGKD